MSILRVVLLSLIFISYPMVNTYQLEEVKAMYNKDLEILEFNGRVYKVDRQIKMFSELPIENNVDSNAYLISEPPKEESPIESETSRYTYMLIVLFLTLFAGAMSGLTVGYLSIDDLVLELKSKTGTDIEQEYAKRILPILNRRHWLLVTLLLWNATAMEALPIFLNKLVDEFMAIIISVTLVLFFGEIIPQALCTGPGQLQIASFLAPMVNFLMYISYPISYPIALLLDHLLGKHSKSRFLNTDLKGLIELHTLEALDKLSKEQGHDLMHEKPHEIGLHTEQADLMISALDIKQRKASEMMISLDNVYMIEYESIIDKSQIQEILEKGFSRIPVYSKEKNNVLGILRIKQLIGVDLSQCKSIRQLGLKLSPPLIIHPTTPALDLLSEFRKGRSHMAFITPNVEEYKQKFEEINKFSYKLGRGKYPNERVLGMVTLEDVIEKMINIEILDEDDYARNKILHEKKGTHGKSRFYKDAITRELAISFMEDKKDQLNSILASSFSNKHGNTFLLRNNYGDNQMSQLKEPLL